MSKIKINLAIRATDDPAKVKIMLEFLKAEGFTLTPFDGTPPNVPRPTVQASRLATYGPNETAWREVNPNTRAPVYSPAMQGKYPNGKEDMFAAYLNGSLTESPPARSADPNDNAPQLGAVLTGHFEMPEPSEDDY